MEQFTPISGFVGGCLIGFAAIALLFFNRKICGISGMVAGMLPPYSEESRWQVSFLGGLLTGGFLLHFIYPQAFEFTLQTSLPVTLVAGFLVGFGSRLGMGCTSGHGVCGMGRLAPRSIVATLIFLVTAMVTATLWGLYA